MAQSIWRTAATVMLLVVSSALHAGTDIEARPPAVAPYTTAYQVVAFSGDRFLTVWRSEMREAGSHLLGALSDRNGHLISDVAFPIGMFNQATWIELVAVDRGWAVFWANTYSEAVTYMATVDENGTVTARRRLSLPRHEGATVAWNGRHFLVAMQHPAFPTRTASAVLLDREGNTFGSAIALDPAASNTLAVVAAGEMFVVILPTERGMVAQYRITSDGDVVVHRFEQRGGANSLVAMHIGGGDVLAVRRLAGTQNVLESAIFSADGTRTPVRRLTLTSSETLWLAGVTGDGSSRSAFRLWLRGWSSREQRPITWTVPLDPARDVVDPDVTTLTDAVGANPRVATSGNVVVITGSERISESRTDIRTTAFTANDTLLHSEVVSRLPARQFEPRIGGAGAFLAAWTASLPSGSSLRAAQLDPSGAPAGVAAIADDAVLGSEELGWNGVGYLLVWWRGRSLLATRITASGQSLDPTPISVASVSSDHGGRAKAAVTWAGDRWLVAWISDYKMHIAAVTPSGIAAPPRELAFPVPIPNDWRRAPGPLTLAFDGRKVLIAWYEFQTSSSCAFPCLPFAETYAALLDPSGAPLGTSVLHIRSDAAHISVASSGREFLVLTEGRTDATVTIIHASESVLTTATTRELFAFPGPVRGDVAWDGSEYVVAVRYSAFISDSRYPFPSYVALRRLNAAGVEVGVPRARTIDLLDSVAAPGVAAPSVAGGPSGAVIVLHEARPGDSARVAAYGERELPLLPAVPAAPAVVSAWRLDNTALELTWEAAAGADGYIIETALSADHFARNAVLPGNLRTATVSTFGTNLPVRVRAFNAGGLGAPSALTTPRERPLRRRATRR